MATDDEKRREREDAELERDVRSQRRFDLAEAIGRAGAGLMKGASPVAGRREAELALEHFLESRLEDPEGALVAVLRRHVRDSEELLAASYEDPLAVLGRIVEGLRRSPEQLRGLVREADAEWGRMYLERPHFEMGGRPPDPDDPYTVASVGEALDALAKSVQGDG